MFDRPLLVECSKCGGRGRLADHPCSRCRGTGQVPSQRGREILDLFQNERDLLFVEEEG